MKMISRDIISTILAVGGGVIVFAKLNAYSWWSLGSWTSVLGVLAVIGAAILLTNIQELAEMSDGAAVMEFLAWLAAVTVTIPSLAAVTTRAEFIWSGAMIGLAWAVQTTRHAWRATRHRGQHYPHIAAT
jgi:hypothetical protein